MADSLARAPFIDFPDIHYTELEQETWRILFDRYIKLIPLCMCPEYQREMMRIGFSPHTIPRLADVDKVLHQNSGWLLFRVNEITPDDEYYSMLARRVFPANDFIRALKDIDYTPQPDLFHELVGHVPMLMNPDIADFAQHIGVCAQKIKATLGGNGLKMLSRISWFTLEFGLIKIDQGPRIFGAGFAPGEMKRFLEGKINLKPFDVNKAANHTYKFWEVQQELYVVESFADMRQQFDRWFQKVCP